MAITFKNRPPVVEPPQTKEIREETIFDALNQLNSGKIGTLMLVHRENGKSFQVLGYDQKTRVATMKNTAGQKLRPCLTEREEKIYRPVWR